MNLKKSMIKMILDNLDVISHIMGVGTPDDSREEKLAGLVLTAAIGDSIGGMREDPAQTLAKLHARLGRSKSYDGYSGTSLTPEDTDLLAKVVTYERQYWLGAKDPISCQELMYNVLFNFEEPEDGIYEEMMKVYKKEKENNGEYCRLWG